MAISSISRRGRLYVARTQFTLPNEFVIPALYLQTLKNQAENADLKISGNLEVE